jgi:hypothetical protein
MAKARRRPSRSNKDVFCDHSHFAKKKMMMGALLFLAGFLLFLGYTWDIVLMAVGALIVLKSLFLRGMHR